MHNGRLSTHDQIKVPGAMLQVSVFAREPLNVELLWNNDLDPSVTIVAVLCGCWVRDSVQEND